MLKEQLINREDLLETLDTEPIFDYLLQHGALDKAAMDGICNEKTAQDRNTALLRYLESNGNNAVALFINALRQSGQLHLASTLDVSQRIKPISGTGYWEKQRHKGQVMVKIQVKAIRVLAPETPEKHEIYDVKMTPRRLHKSYDNMLMLDGEDVPSPKPIRIVNYPYEKEDEDEENFKRKRSCWCMCFPFFKSRRKTEKEKKYSERGKHTNSVHNSRSPSHSSKQSFQQTSPVKRKNRSPSKSEYTKAEKNQNGHSNSRTSSPLKDVSHLEYKNSVNGRRAVYIHNSGNKENLDPVIMRYNEQLELVELKRFSYRGSPDGNNGLSRVTMRAKWKSEGKLYEEKCSQFYGLFERDLKNSCIKYFEQSRGSLILQIFSDNQGITVFNICMTKKQVQELQDDYKCGQLKEKFLDILINSGTIDRLEVQDIDLTIVIDDIQFQEAMDELST